MLELPPNFRLGYRDYQVEHISEEDRGKHLGWHIPQKHLVQVDVEDIRPTEVVNTFIHEVLHGIFELARFNLKQAQEEEIVCCLSNGLTQFFKDNPKTIMWILETCQRDTNGKTSKAR